MSDDGKRVTIGGVGVDHTMPIMVNTAGELKQLGSIKEIVDAASKLKGAVRDLQGQVAKLEMDLGIRTAERDCQLKHTASYKEKFEKAEALVRVSDNELSRTRKIVEDLEVECAKFRQLNAELTTRIENVVVTPAGPDLSVDPDDGVPWQTKYELVADKLTAAQNERYALSQEVDRLYVKLEQDAPVASPAEDRLSVVEQSQLAMNVKLNEIRIALRLLGVKT